MKLEDIFNDQMLTLKNRIETIGGKYPQLIKAFSLKKNDPHIERMISSFALISSSLELEVAKKMAKEIKSIFINVYPDEFSTIVPTGIIQAKPNFGEIFKIEKHTSLRDGKNIFRTKRDFFINDINIEEVELSEFNNQMGLNIKFSGNNINKITNIDLMLDFQSINGIFKNENTVEAVLKNRLEYSSKCTITLHEESNLKEFCIYQEQFYFARISNLQIQSNIGNSLEIFIPTKLAINPKNINIKTNQIVIENKFKSQSFPFKLKGKEETRILVDSDMEIVKVTKLVDQNGNIIPNIKQNNNGWHVISNKDGLSIYLDNIFDDTVYAEVECYNKDIKYDQIFFEEYVPASLSWCHLPHEAYQYIYRDEISKIVQIMSIDDIDGVLNIISQLISIYNNSLNIDFKNIEIMESVKPVTLINYTVPKLFSIVSCSTNTINFILLRQIINEVRKKTNNNIDFLFKTPLGEVIYDE